MKKLNLFLLALTVLLCLAPTAFAHKGKTDGNGGHTDSATGEYHYHHGYPAHSHYDMDGDGIVDCPYDFEDRTNHNGSGSTGSNSVRTQGLTYNDGYKYGYDKGYDDGYQAGQDYVEKEKDSSYKNGYKAGEEDMLSTFDEKYSEQLSDEKTNIWIIAVCAMLFLGVPAVSAITQIREEKNYNRQKKEAEQRHKAEVDKLNKSISDMKSAVADAENRYELLRSGFDPLRSNCIPDGVKVASIVLPVKGIASKDRPYGDYTVYTSSQGTRYHARYGCGNATRPIHFFTRPTNLAPCRNCVPHDMYPQPLPDWYLDLIGQNEHVKLNENRNAVIEEPAKKTGISSGKKFGPNIEEFTIIRRSSFIYAVCYKNGNLYVKTTQGGFFMYYNVPHPVFSEFLKAESMGRYYNQNIVDKYPFSQLRVIDCL